LRRLLQFLPPRAMGRTLSDWTLRGADVHGPFRQYGGRTCIRFEGQIGFQMPRQAVLDAGVLFFRDLHLLQL
jgi:hypothetical protein